MNLPLPFRSSAGSVTWIRSWAFVQQELLALCWGIMDVSLLVPFALSLMPFARYWPPGQLLAWLLLLMLFAFYLTRLLSALYLPAQQQQVVTAVLLTVILFFSIRAILHNPVSFWDVSWIGDFITSLTTSRNNLWSRDVALFLLIVYIWSRGLQLAGRSYQLDSAGLRLRLGGLIFAPLIVWLGHNRLIWNPAPFLLLFFLSSLTAIALIRAAEIEKERSGRLVSLSPRWFIGIFGAALLTIFTAGVTTILISGETSPQIIGWLSPFWLGLTFIFVVSLSTLFYLFLPLLTWLDGVVLGGSGFLGGFFSWLALQFMVLGKMAGKLGRGNRTPTAFEGAVEQTPIGEAESVLRLIRQFDITPTRLIAALLILLGLGLILLVSLLVGRMLQPQEAAAPDGTAAARADEARQERNLAQRLLQRFGMLRGWRTAVSIRRIYRLMLAAAAANGYPRLETETPYEYLGTLREAWPENRRETELITRAYVNIRYGELPETEAELAEIRQAWQTLETHQPQEPAGER